MIEYLEKEDLPQSLQDVEEVIGIDVVKKLVNLVGGSSIYIPSKNNIVKPVRNRIIKENFKGSYKELSNKFGISEMQVRNIIKSNN